jgi:hypothetical protein|tara:strand:+ start:272 stop:490 length:219 start_codon:yes stop_codon:yes gene_type:complete
MAKRGARSALSGVVNLAVWLTGILVSLAVGFGMTDGVLAVRWIPEVVTQVAGWIVIILTLISVVLAIVDRAS